ncbi:C2 calcium-dependent domain-containing protein 4C [Cololabis saira]|uniref:C2 calcium-dependent domain-containing protein 4C n=1 Tax=Cololabis saira TaxID=129043 RepID=UPI002AD4DFC3|nr:C2 calcium-dependent domain-containing protein 4C [Cololabis saira]
MWVFGKIRDSVENIPLELNRYMGKNEAVISPPSTTSISHNLHSNIITPDNIPEFCLPPQLCKRSPLPEAEKTPASLHFQNPIQNKGPSSNIAQTKIRDVKKKKKKQDNALEPWKTAKKHLPFTAEVYGLSGIYESPNTRRKESLFHSKSSVYLFERSVPSAAPSLRKETNPSKKILSGFLPLFSCKSLSEAGSMEGETPSSSDSSPLCSPYTAKSSNFIPTRTGCLKETVSCPSLIDTKGKRGRREKVGLSLKTFPCTPPSFEKKSHTLSPPILYPLDVLQCQERLQREHVLPLQGRGKVRLSAEHTAFSNSPSSTLSTIRVRVVSVEGLWDHTDHLSLNCAVNLCLTPGKQQQQESATIRNCRNPVFNEDFFFTELSHEDLLELHLRLKVLDKPAAGTLWRGTVIGVVNKPLSQLLPVNKWVEE